MNFLEGKKSSIVFCVAIAVGLFQRPRDTGRSEGLRITVGALDYPDESC